MVCTPSINIDGVNNREDKIYERLLNAKCGACKLHENLTGQSLALWEEMNNE